MGKPRAARSLGVWETTPAAVLVAFMLVACGSERLETIAQLATAGSSGTDSVAGADTSGGVGGSPLPGAGGSAGGSGMGVAAGAGGEPGPIMVEPLVTFDDFDQSFTVGPLTAERVTVEGQPFAEAWQASLSEPPGSEWVAQLVMPLNKPVPPGQLLHVSFWVFCESPGLEGDCFTEYIFERASEPWEKSVTFPANATAEWQQRSEYFRAREGYESGVAHMVFRLGYESHDPPAEFRPGYEKQRIVIGGLKLEAIPEP